jgi:hypothetical protein
MQNNAPGRRDVPENRSPGSVNLGHALLVGRARGELSALAFEGEQFARCRDIFAADKACGPLAFCARRRGRQGLLLLLSGLPHSEP